MQPDNNINNDVTANHDKSMKKAKGGIPVLVASVFGLIAVCAVGFWAIDSFTNSKDNYDKVKLAFMSYRTNKSVELKAEASNNSKTVAFLKEGTMLSGKSSTSKDGVDWIEVTSVDGQHGFLPISSVYVVGQTIDFGQMKPNVRKITTVENVNMREIPSISGKIIGSIDKGTSLFSDGSIESQGEEWLRIRLGKNTTAFIMARFTTVSNQDGLTEAQKENNANLIGTVSSLANLQATPFADSRIIRALNVGDEVSIIGQTQADDWWYIVRLGDGTQGFIPKAFVDIPDSEMKWVYPDGSPAPGPDIPEDVANQMKANANAAQAAAKAGSQNANVNPNVAATIPSFEPVKVLPKPKPQNVVPHVPANSGVAVAKPNADVAYPKAEVIPEASPDNSANQNKE